MSPMTSDGGTLMINGWIKASYILNIVVLVPVCMLILRDGAEAARVFGPNGTARQILVCMYLAILGASVTGMVQPAWALAIALPLLTIQVFYKTLSVFLIKDKSTPVLWFNLVIAMFHAWSLYTQTRQ